VYAFNGGLMVFEKQDRILEIAFLKFVNKLCCA
jgi:hypothetical protein